VLSTLQLPPACLASRGLRGLSFGSSRPEPHFGRFRSCPCVPGRRQWLSPAGLNELGPAVPQRAGLFMPRQASFGSHAGARAFPGKQACGFEGVIRHPGDRFACSALRTAGLCPSTSSRKPRSGDPGSLSVLGSGLSGATVWDGPVGTALSARPNEEARPLRTGPPRSREEPYDEQSHDCDQKFREESILPMSPGLSARTSPIGWGRRCFRF
jgi:hypothetical protein